MKVVAVKCLTLLAVLTWLIAESAFAKEPFRWPDGAQAAIVLTYDDSAVSQLDHAIPQLNRAKLKGTFFLIGNMLTASALPRWRDAAKQGHELANHSMSHPCPGLNPPNNSHFNIKSMIADIQAMNLMLSLIDNREHHSYATPCASSAVLDGSYLKALRTTGIAPFVRTGVPYRQLGTNEQNPTKIDLYDVPSVVFDGSAGDEMIAYVNRIRDSGGLGVMTFHGVEGDWMKVSARAHQELIDYLAANRIHVWVATFEEVMTYIARQRDRSPPSRP